jgi:hypothetical protein
MTIWKIRHKPTGLFYKPSCRGSKTQLSPTGKLYEARKPTLKSVGRFIHVRKEQLDGTSCKVEETGKYWHEARMPIVADDWEIVRYKMVEDGVES